ARPHPGDPFTHLHDLAGAVRAGDERQLLLRVVLPADGEQVAIVERRGAHAHQHLAVARPWIGPFGEDQVVQAEGAADLDGSHSAASALLIAATSSRAVESASFCAGQRMPSPSLPNLGMTWKCTCITTWWAAAPLARITARQTRGSTRPIAAADSSESWCSCAFLSLGMTRVWPAESGPMSRKAKTWSSSY